jgi:ABC-type branched-subunit amino acid transport system permease subunit
MVAAYLLTIVNFPYVTAALLIGTIAAAITSYLVGLIALRRTGIYFAMITVAIARSSFSSSSTRCRNIPAARMACRGCRRRRSISV